MPGTDGIDPREALRRLAADGLLGGPDLRSGYELIRSLATADLASAFSLWAHTMVLECLAASSSPELVAHSERLRRGAAWGSTAMAPAIKHLAGLGELPVSYRRDGAGLVLDGRIPWASNLFDENVVLVLSARSATDAADDPVVLAVDGRDASVHFGAPLPLLALDRTASSTVDLRGTRVSSAATISTDLAGYMRTMKPRLLLLQTAYCLGLAGASTAAGAAGLPRTAQTHRADHATLTEQLAELEEQARALVDDVDRSRQVAMPDVVRLRLRAARLAEMAVRLELRLTGGAGFVAGSPTARRYREVAFLPVQTPTEGQLLTELG